MRQFDLSLIRSQSCVLNRPGTLRVLPPPAPPHITIHVSCRVAYTYTHPLVPHPPHEIYFSGPTGSGKFSDHTCVPWAHHGTRAHRHCRSAIRLSRALCRWTPHIYTAHKRMVAVTANPLQSDRQMPICIRLHPFASPRRCRTSPCC